MKLKNCLLGTAVAFAVLPSVASAAVIVTTTKSAIATPPAFSTTDLGQTALLSSSGTGGNESGQSAELFNGVIGNTDNDTTDSGEVTLNNTNSITLNLNVTTNTLGYDITGIDTIAGWDPVSGGRSNQGYSVTLGLVSGGSLTLFSATHWEPNSPSSYWTKVSFANSGGGALFSDTVNLNGAGATAGNSVLASGVKSITWGISQNANPGGIVVFREFDVFGVPTVPEPSGVALLGLGGGLLFLRRRRV